MMMMIKKIHIFYAKKKQCAIGSVVVVCVLLSFLPFYLLLAYEKCVMHAHVEMGSISKRFTYSRLEVDEDDSGDDEKKKSNQKEFHKVEFCTVCMSRVLFFFFFFFLFLFLSFTICFFVCFLVSI